MKKAIKITFRAVLMILCLIMLFFKDHGTRSRMLQEEYADYFR